MTFLIIAESDLPVCSVRTYCCACVAMCYVDGDKLPDLSMLKIDFHRASIREKNAFSSQYSLASRG